jgi:hypothetical protein
MATATKGGTNTAIRRLLPMMSKPSLLEFDGIEPLPAPIQNHARRVNAPVAHNAKASWLGIGGCGTEVL